MHHVLGSYFVGVCNAFPLSVSYSLIFFCRMLPLRGRRAALLGRGTSALARRSLVRLCSVSHAPVDSRALLLHRPSCAPPAFGSGPSWSLLLHADRSPAPPVEDATSSMDIIMPGGLGGLTLEMPAGAEVTVETPGVESEHTGETIQAVGKKGWRTYQPSLLRRKRRLGFLKCAAALSPVLQLRPTSLPMPYGAHTAPRPVTLNPNPNPKPQTRSLSLKPEP